MSPIQNDTYRYILKKLTEDKTFLFIELGRILVPNLNALSKNYPARTLTCILVTRSNTPFTLGQEAETMAVRVLSLYIEKLRLTLVGLLL